MDGLEGTPAADRLISRIKLIKKIWHPNCKSVQTKTHLYQDTSKMKVDSRPDVKSSPMLRAGIEDFDLIITGSVTRDFEKRKVPMKNRTNSIDVLSEEIPQRKPYDCLDDWDEIFVNESQKVKMDRFLNFSAPILDFGDNHLTMQNQRIVNMASSTHDLHDGTNFQTLGPTSEGRDSHTLPSPIKTHKSSLHLPLTAPNRDLETHLQYHEHFGNNKLRTSISTHSPIMGMNGDFHDERYNRERGASEYEQTSGIPTDSSNRLPEVLPYKYRLSRQRRLTETTEPDSPCSVTPFILPEKKPTKNLSDIRRQQATVRYLTFH